MVLLTAEQGKTLLSLARNAIKAHFDGSGAPMPHAPVFKEKRGVFCTLKTPVDVLRGCIGHPYPDSPLAEALVDSAVSAAVRDPRFKPLAPEELEDIRIEVTVLTQPKKLDGPRKSYPSKIMIGTHGLIVSTRHTSGLLLPQVAVENGEWTPVEFLEATCWKAGLPPDAWKDDATEVSTFEGQIFLET